MANGGYFNHLVSIIFQTVDSQKAVTDIKSVQKQLEFNWAVKDVDKTGESIANIGDKSKIAGTGLSALSNNLEGFTSILKLSKVTYDEFGQVTGTMVTEKLKNQEGVMKQVTTQFDKQGKVIKTNVQDIKAASVGMSDFINAMKRAVIVAPIWMIMRTAIQGVTSLIQNQIKFMLDMEDAMAKIKIVGKGTAEEFENLRNTLVALSFTYGVSASAALDAAQIFAQQGRSVTETISLTRAAMIGSKALGEDIKNVVNDLTAAVEGFNLPVNQAVTIVDRWVAVEKEFAVTSKDLADATKASGATANQLGITLSEFLGDVTAIIEVTRKSGSEAARGLSFIYARLLTTGKETVQNLTKIPYYLNEQGVATDVLTKKLRSHADILGDLALKWNTLEKGERLQIATALGSMRQMVVLNALMQNYSRSIDARIVSLTSAGAAERAFGIMQETTRVKLTQLASAWNNFTNEVGDTTNFKKFVDMLAESIMGLTSLLNIQAAVRFEAQKTNAVQKAGIEAKQNEISSLEELIKAREKLGKAPKTTENLQRAETVNTALQNIVKDFPEVELDIESGTTEKLRKQILRITDILTLQNISADVSVEFVAKSVSLKEEREKMTRFARMSFGEDEYGGNGKSAKERIKEIDIELLGLIQEQTDKVTEQFETYKGIANAKKINLENEEIELDAADKLTEQEKEKLDIADKLIIAKQLYGDNLVGLIEYEKKLTEEAKYQELGHEKNLSLRILESKLLEATISANDKMIEHELELAKIRGVSSRQLLEIESTLLRQLYGEKAITNNKDLQYRKEVEITKEKLHQNELSSTTMKLYDIAMANGVEAAVQIGDFLQGNISFDRLKEMPRIYEIFKKEFADLNKQMIAEDYFNGISNGFARMIPIAERFNDITAQMKANEFYSGKTNGYAGLIPISERASMRTPISEALKNATPINVPNVNITPTFGGININLPKGMLEDLANLSGKKLTEVLRNSKEFKDLIDGFTTDYTGKGK